MHCATSLSKHRFCSYIIYRNYRTRVVSKTDKALCCASCFRLGKVYSSFLITHFFNLDTGGQSLFIIGMSGMHYNYAHAYTVYVSLSRSGAHHVIKINYKVGVASP